MWYVRFVTQQCVPIIVMNLNHLNRWPDKFEIISDITLLAMWFNRMTDKTIQDRAVQELLKDTKR